MQFLVCHVQQFCDTPTEDLSLKTPRLPVTDQTNHQFAATDTYFSQLHGSVFGNRYKAPMFHPFSLQIALERPTVIHWAECTLYPVIPRVVFSTLATQVGPFGMAK